MEGGREGGREEEEEKRFPIDPREYNIYIYIYISVITFIYHFARSISGRSRTSRHKTICQFSAGWTSRENTMGPPVV